MDAEIIDRNVVYDRWTTVTDTPVRLPNGAIKRRVMEDHGNAAGVLLYDPERKVALLLRQPRAPVLSVGAPCPLEVAAGRLDGDDAAACARREALEEAGVAVRELDEVATVWSMPAVSTERITLYLAAYSMVDRVAAGGGAADENECIELVELPLAVLWQRMTDGSVVDARTLLLVQALRLRRPVLFT